MAGRRGVGWEDGGGGRVGVWRVGGGDGEGGGPEPQWFIRWEGGKDYICK